MQQVSIWRWSQARAAAEARLTTAQRFALERARAEQSLSRASSLLREVQKRFDPAQPRDEHGRWMDGGGGDLTSIDVDAVEAKTKLNVGEASYQASKDGTKPLPGSKSEHPATIASRNPTAKGSQKVYGQPDVASMRLDPKRYEHDIGMFKNPDFYPNFRAKDLAGTTDQATRNVVEQMKGNLEFLYRFADTHTLVWYDGARALVDDRVKLWGFNDASVAAVYAALSPTKDWDQNVHIADMLMKTYKTQQNHRWDDAMEAKAAAIWSAKLQPVVDKVRGKTLGELTDPKDKALWIRTYDETHNSTNYRTVLPNGALGEVVRNKDKERTPSKVVWQSLPSITNAVKALEANGDREIISAAMGNAHKVRSFYNNILDPHSANGDVTIDTHAVGAALLRQLSGSTVPVAHNFGNTMMKVDQPEGWEAVGASTKTGLSGLYPVYAQAYREAAKDLGIQPRQLQSAVWVVKRDTFDKLSKKGQDAIEAAWHDYHDNRGVTLEQTRIKIAEILGLGKNERVYELDEGSGRPTDPRELHRIGMGQPAAAMDGGTRNGVAGRIAGLDAVRGTQRRIGAEEEEPITFELDGKHWRDLYRAVTRAFDPSEPRDEGGKWTAGGGGADSSTGAGAPAHGIHGLPADIKIKSRALEQAIARNAFDVTAKPIGKDSYGDERYELTITAKLPPGTKSVEWHGRTEYYDPKLARLETIDAGTQWERQIPRPKEGLTSDIAPLPDKDVIYRGMSDDEYQHYRETGRIESRGDYNLTGQEGLTYWTTETDTAEAYANGFAPWPMKPTFEKPAWVVATHKPAETRDVPGTGENEVGVARPISKDEIIAVWRGDAYAHRAGKMDLVHDESSTGTNYREGSGSNPTTSVVWSRRDHTKGLTRTGLIYRAAEGGSAFLVAA